MCRSRVCATGAPSSAGAAPLVQLEHVEARRAAQDLAHLAGLHGRERGGEELRQPVVAAPAERAALQRVGRVGVARGEAREIARRRAPRRSAFCARARAASMRSGRRLLRHAHQDVRDLVLDARCRASPCVSARNRSISLSLTWMRSSTSRSRRRDSTICSRSSSRQAWNGDAVALQRARGNRPGSCCCSARRAAPRGRAAARRRGCPCRARAAAAPCRGSAARASGARAGRARGSGVPCRRSWRCAAATASSSSVAVITSLFTTATMRSTGMHALRRDAERKQEAAVRRSSLFMRSKHLLERQPRARARRRERGVRRVGHRVARARCASAARPPRRCRCCPMPLNSSWKTNAVEVTSVRRLDAQRDRPEHPAAGVVLEAGQALQQLLVQDGVIVAPHAVPARRRAATAPEMSTCFEHVRAWKR